MNKILVKPYLTGHAAITKNMQAKQAVLVYKKEYPCVYITVNLSLLSKILNLVCKFTSNLFNKITLF